MSEGSKPKRERDTTARDAARYRALSAELERSSVWLEIASAQALDFLCDALREAQEDD